MSDLAVNPTKPTVHNDDSTDKTIFGFWIYIMTDCVLFATLFATFAVLRNQTNGGPTGAELFSLPFVLVETMLLLTSSFTIGLGMLAAHKGLMKQVIFWLGVTFLLGIAFLTMELTEFSHLVQDGDSWKESAFLSSFFTLVGTHGLHVLAGLTWMAVLIGLVIKRGLNKVNIKRLTLLSMFWHFLGIVWIFIFTIVYLMGAL